MATFNTTKTKYPQRFEDGQKYYNELDEKAKKCLTLEGAILGRNFNLIEFYTEAQKRIFSRQTTWCWTKCFLSAEAVREIIMTTDLADCVEHYACCTHDKDDAEPHTHLLIKFKRNENIASRLVAYFHIDSYDVCKHDVKARFNYLTHDSDKCRKQGKYQYEKTSILTDDIDFFERFEEVNEEVNVVNIIDDIIKGVSTRTLCLRYGKDYAYHIDKFDELARRICSEEEVVRTRYDISYVTDDIVAIYDEGGNLVEICRNWKEARNIEKSIN